MSPHRIATTPVRQGRITRTLARSLFSGSLPRVVEDDAFGHQALSDEAPECNQQLAGKSHDQLLAGIPVGSGARLVPFYERAVRLIPEETPGKLDHAMTHAGIAGTGETPLAAPGAALVRGLRIPTDPDHCFRLIATTDSA